MEDSEKSIVTLSDAATALGITSVDSLKRAAKNAKCLIRGLGGIWYVDLEAIRTYLDEYVQKQAEVVRSRREKPANQDQIGILMARAKMYPKWIEAKVAAMVRAEALVAQPQSIYEKAKAKRALAKLQSELEQMQHNQKTDEVKLQTILNGGEPLPTVAA